MLNWLAAIKQRSIAHASSVRRTMRTGKAVQDCTSSCQGTTSGLLFHWDARPRPGRSNGREAGLNKAAGAADAGSQVLRGDSVPGDKVRVTRRSCDPLTQNDAGGTPAS